MAEAKRISRASEDSRGVNISVILAMPPEERTQLLKLIELGFSMDDAVQTLAEKVSSRVDLMLTEGRIEHANPVTHTRVTST